MCSERGLTQGLVRGPAAGAVAGSGRAWHGGAGEEQVPGGPVPRAGGGRVVPLAAVYALV